MTALRRDTTPDETPAPVEEHGLQFRLSTIFVLTLIATILAAFLSPHGDDMMLAGFVTATASLLFALLVGWLRPPRMDRIFWGAVVAAMMQVVLAEVILLDRPTEIYAWPLAAGFAGVIAAGRSGLYRRMMCSALMAGSIILAYVVAVLPTATITVSYIAASYVTCAVIGGALLAILVDGVRWLACKRRIPQSAVGLSLVLAAIAFAVAAPRLIPGW